MRVFVFILVSVLLMTGCNTTTKETQSGQSKSKSSEEATSELAYNVGKLVGYSELCSEYRGSGVDKILLKDLKDRFENDPEFAKGYRRFSMSSGYDRIDGLNECKTVSEALEKIGQAYSKS